MNDQVQQPDQEGGSNSSSGDRRAGQPNGRVGRRVFVRTSIGLGVAVLSTPALLQLARWWNRPEPLEFTVYGPFEHGEKIQLKRYRSDFVAPISLRLRDRMGEGGASVTYAFKGEQRQDRQISVSITLLDEDGCELASSQTQQTDARLTGGTPVRMGSTLVVKPVVNFHAVQVPIGMLTRTHAVRLTSSEVVSRR